MITTIHAQVTTWLHSTGYAKTASYAETRYASINFFTLSSDVYFQVSINDSMLQGAEIDDLGMLRGKRITLNDGDRVTLAVYRVYEFFSNAKCVGTLTGTYTAADGFTLDSDTKSLKINRKDDSKRYHTFPGGKSTQPIAYDGIRKVTITAKDNS